MSSEFVELDLISPHREAGNEHLQPRVRHDPRQGRIDPQPGGDESNEFIGRIDLGGLPYEIDNGWSGGEERLENLHSRLNVRVGSHDHDCPSRWPCLEILNFRAGTLFAWRKQSGSPIRSMANGPFRNRKTNARPAD
ncbi:protein of unknown function [Agreia sp. COWG]|nr:protein of unknown function [Agreia sp. COWG]